MMDKTKIYAELQDIFAEVFMRDDILLSASLSAKDVAGWDSIKQVEIIMETEQRFGVRFASNEVDSFRNVGDIVATLMRRVALAGRVLGCAQSTGARADNPEGNETRRQGSIRR
jgi:acyl carrier protein